MYAPIGHLSVVKSADWILSKSVSVVNWAAHAEEGLLSCVVEDAVHIYLRLVFLCISCFIISPTSTH